MSIQLISYELNRYGKIPCEHVLQLIRSQECSLTFVAKYYKNSVYTILKKLDKIDMINLTGGDYHSNIFI